MPAISIITPTYNRPDLLAEAIQSVLDQTFADWEMLIIEDGSDGSARAVVAGFNDPRLRYFYQAHAGRSAARNSGLEAVRGALITFLDDDDLYHPQKLAHDFAFMRSYERIEILGSGFRLIDNRGKVQSIWEPWILKPELNADNCLYGSPLANCSVIVRSSALQRLDHWFDPRFNRSETDDFFLRLLLAGSPFSWLYEVNSDHRLFGERTMLIFFENFNNYRQVLNKIFDDIYLPADMRQKREIILLHHTLFNAWKAYALSVIKTAQRFLLNALLQEPSLADESSGLLIDGLVYTALNTYYVNDSKKFIDFVLSHLPSPLVHLQERLDEIYSRIRTLEK